MTQDLYSKLEPVIAVNTQTISNSSTVAGNEIDTQGYQGMIITLQTGTLSDGTYTLLIQDKDEGGSYADVSDTYLLGTEAGTALTGSNKVSSIGYIGQKRYVKVSIVASGLSSGGVVGAIANLGFADVEATPKAS